MDSRLMQQSDPSLLLLNEITVLLAYVRLFEVAALVARLAQGKATILAEGPAVGKEAKLARQTF